MMSDITPRSFLSLTTHGKTELSQDKVFPLMLQEVSEKTEELQSLGKRYETCNSKISRSRSISNSKSEDHRDILYNKGIFVDKLTQAVEEIVDSSLQDPKYTINCYNQFSSLFETRCSESKQNIKQKIELLREQKLETTCIISQGNIFVNLVEEENEDLRNQEHRQATLQFEEAKGDLTKLINIIYPNEEEKNNFLLVMAKLVEAHMNNLDNIEDQYVEILPSFITNPGLRCLMEGCVVVEHPNDPTKHRLSVDD